MRLTKLSIQNYYILLVQLIVFLVKHKQFNYINFEKLKKEIKIYSLLMQIMFFQKNKF